MIKIPLKPVSVNAAWQGRRFKTQLYKDFEQEMLAIMPRNLCKIPGNYAIHLKFFLKNARACDLSNFIKTTEDIIVKAGIVDDDRFCWHMTVEKFKSKENYLEFGIISLP